MFCCLDWACYKGLTWPLITLFLSLCLHFFIVILLYDFDKIIVEHFLFFEDIYFMIFGRKTCRNASVAVLVIMFGVGFGFFWRVWLIIMECLVYIILTDLWANASIELRRKEKTITIGTYSITTHQMFLLFPQHRTYKVLAAVLHNPKPPLLTLPLPQLPFPIPISHNPFFHNPPPQLIIPDRVQTRPKETAIKTSAYAFFKRLKPYNIRLW